MTREDAISIMNVIVHMLEEKYDTDRVEEAVDMAIKALEQEPCEDCISRKALLEEIENGIKAGNYKEGYEEYPHINDMDDIIECIKYADSIQPKTGHWEWVQYDYNPKFGNWHCSECRCVVVECVGKEEKGGIPLYKYCPQCGAKMESEDKE